MPFTPYHFGPSATIGLPLEKHLDVPAFVLANVAVDVEPLIVMLFNLNYPLHGYCHTLLIGAVVGILAGVLLFMFRPVTSFFMNMIRLEYKTTLLKAVLSSIFSVWFHVILDSFIYSDIRPLFPSSANPLYGLLSSSTLYALCAVMFIPAIVIYLIKVMPKIRQFLINDGHDAKR
jgi:hypothetical protein